MKHENFRIVNEKGDEVGEAWGYNYDKRTLIFEGKWDSLAGLSLEGNGHREALPLASPPSPKPKVGKRDDMWIKDLLDMAEHPRGGVVVEAVAGPVKPELGKPVSLVLSIRNLNERPISIERLVFGMSVPFGVTLLDSAGQSIPLSYEGRKVWPRESFGSARTTEPIDLAPACAFSVTIPLDRYFQLRGPGKYTAIGSFSIGNDLEAIAKPICIGLRKPSDQKSAEQNDHRRETATGGHVPDRSDTESKQWADAAAMAGRLNDGMFLDAGVSPVDRNAVNLVVSLHRAVGNGASDECRLFSDGECVIPDDPTPKRGTFAGDYRLLVRDTSGRFLQLGEAGRQWLATHHITRRRNLQVGEAVGFVFPLQEMFDLKPDVEYTVMAILQGDANAKAAWVAKPVTIRVPQPIVAGVNRPPYGSGTFWQKLLPTAGLAKEDMALSVSGECSDGSVIAHLRLANQAEHSIIGTPYPFNAIMLVRDNQGNVVPANENRRGYRIKGWSRDPKVAVLPGEIFSDNSCEFGLVYHLQPGKRYSVIAAMNATSDREAYRGQGNADKVLFFASKPTVISIPDADDHACRRNQDDVGVESPPSAIENPPLPFDRQWQDLGRFAGKPFEGLQLNASIDDSLRLTLSLKNVAAEAIAITKWKGDSDYEIRIRGPNGKSVGLTEHGKEFFARCRILDVRHLDSGESITAALPIGELFVMRDPGEYTLLASLPVIGDIDAVVTAKPVKVRVQ